MMRRNLPKRLLAVILAAIMLIGIVPLNSLAADSFETSISAFPESYKPYLRSLHQAHPNWKFEALNTGLEWTAAVDAEYAPNKSLVINASAYTDIFKSREASDYNASTGVYDQKDAGFVRGNKLAVSYYMDPRNFLHDKGIFLFEKLSFDATFNVAQIESILKGSFMENKKIEYLNAKGEKKTMSEKYSEVIYNAGKTYNINPCFLASKIVNEVGKGGTSTSVSGKNSVYPGIYNYYNIGAYDGANPAQRGLAWASSDSSYGRPWDNPKKSIMGGAQYNAENYIAIGQNTSYLQRFNVNPDCKKPVYSHQYMTNLAGAAHPAYATYQSYLANKMLDNTFVFLIPVYNNMPGEKDAGGSIALADGKNQKATITTTCNVRTGPSTENSTLGFQLPAGTSVNVVDFSFTDTGNPDTISRYPFWAKISFTYSSKSYTGYVYSNYINLTSQQTVKVGAYTPVAFKTNKNLEYRFISSDPSVATITSDKSIKFLKEGTVLITAYDSLMHYQVVKYNVVKSTDGQTISGLKTSNIKETSATVSFTKNSNYSNYEVYVVNSNGKLVKSYTTTSNSVSVSGLSANTSYKAYVRGSKSDKFSPLSSALSFKTAEAPTTTVVNVAPVSNLSAVNSDLKAVKLSWTASPNAKGYCVYTFDSAANKYTLLKDVGTKTSYLDESVNAISNVSYSVRAYVKSGDTVTYSAYCPVVTYTAPDMKPAKVTSLSQKSAAATSVELTWDSIPDVTSYQVYKLSDSGSYTKYATVNTNSCKVTSLSAAKSYQFKVRAVRTLYGTTFNGSYSSVLTAFTATDKVTGVKQSGASTTAYTLSWNEVNGASGYQIYRLDTASNTYKKLADTTDLTYKITGLSAAKKDSYKVRAYVKTANGTYYGSYSDIFYAITTPGKVSNVKESGNTTTSYELSWGKVSGASGYSIYKLDTASNTYKKLADTTALTHKITGLSAAKKDSYKIRAYVKTSSLTVNGSYSDVFIAATSPKKVQNVKESSVTTTSYELSWDKVSGVSGYSIYKLDTASNSYKKLADTTALTYKITGLSAAKKDSYKVRAYIKTGNTTVNGSYSDVLVAVCSPKKVTKVKESAQTQTAYTLSWDKVSGTSGYRIYKLDTASNTYKKLADVTTNSYKVSGLTSATKNSYKVRAFIKTENGTFYGSYSDAFTAVSAPKKVTGFTASAIGKNSVTLTWTKDSKASGYSIYMLDKKTDKLELVVSGKMSSATIDDLNTNTSYVFIIKSYVKTDSVTINSAKSDELLIKTKK